MSEKISWCVAIRWNGGGQMGTERFEDKKAAEKAAKRAEQAAAAAGFTMAFYVAPAADAGEVAA